MNFGHFGGKQNYCESSFSRIKSFGRKQNLSKGRLTEKFGKWSFDRKSYLKNLKNGHLTESSFARFFFRKMVI
jgi:hypothetical protein